MRRVLAWITACGAAASAAGCASAECPDLDEVREKVQDPANVFPVFQQLIRCGDHGTAHDLLSQKTREFLQYPAFHIAFTSYEATRRMIASAQVHALDRVDADTYRLRLCSAEYGVGRDLRLKAWRVAGKQFYQLDLIPDDVEYFKGRALGWYRHQVRRADGWHFAYPPDWTYAPLARACPCGK